MTSKSLILSIKLSFIDGYQLSKGTATELALHITLKIQTATERSEQQTIKTENWTDDESSVRTVYAVYESLNLIITRQFS